MRVCPNCGKSDVVEMDNGRYWCSWCNNWAETSPQGGQEMRVCPNCGKSDVVEMDNGRYWCSWCNNWAETSPSRRTHEPAKSEPGYSNSDRSVALSFLDRFHSSLIPEDCIKAAEEMVKHFTDAWAREAKDNIGRAILDVFVPRKPVRQTFMGKPVEDLTGGRPDTPEWIVFVMIVDRTNPYYYEYFGALEAFASSGHDLRWTLGVLQRLKTTLPRWQEDLKFQEDFNRITAYISERY